jgi:hypothetical protein
MFRALFGASILFIVAPAQAEVVSSSAHGFEVRHSIQTVIPQAAAFDAFGQVSQWWSKDHSYSGDSANMSLSLNPGGCFFERIAGGSRVTMNYRAAGFANGGGEKMAPLVDQVLAEQMARFRKFAAAFPKTR